jgi:beta-phosphoglucomutase-like phosphatase (HAD superfamily)
MTRRPQAVLFDMDGLILDTERLSMRAWSECASALGVQFDPALGLRMIGRNFTDCGELLRAHYAAPYPFEAMLGSWHATYDSILARDGVALKAGVGELLDWLDEVRLPRAVATSTRRERATSKLAQAGVLARFHAVVGGDDVTRGKPAPDIYLEAARRLGVTPAGCLVLEDSEPGARAGLAAGMAVVVVPDLIAPPAELVGAGPLVVQSLHEARAHLAALD